MWLEAGHWNIMITMLPGGSLTLTLGRGWPAHGPDFLVTDPVMENLLLFFVFPSKCWMWTLHRIYCALGGCFGWCFWGRSSISPCQNGQLTGLPLRLVTRTMQVYQAEGARGRCKAGSKGLLEMEGIFNQWLHGDTEGKSLKSLLFRGRVI